MALSATGCHSPGAPEVLVRLHNDAPHAVSARLVLTGTAREQTLLRQTLGPDASATLGPIPKPEHGSVRLVLEPATRDDFILRAPVPTGLTAYRVARPFAVGRLGLAPQAVNPEWTYAGGFMTEHQVQAIAQYEAAEPMQRRADADFDADLDLLDQP